MPFPQEPTRAAMLERCRAVGLQGKSPHPSAGEGTCGAGHHFRGGAKSSVPVLVAGSPQGC